MAFFISLLILTAVGIAGYFVVRLQQRRRISRALNVVLLLIRIPKEQKDQSGGGSNEAVLKSEIAKTEQLVSALSSFGEPFVFEVAVPHVGEEIHFYLALPRRFSESAAKQVQGLWASASVTQESDDYNIFNPNGAVAAAYVRQKEHFAFPIRTYQEIGSDTFSSVIGAFSKLNETGEGAALQVIVRPAGGDYKKKIQQYIRSLKKGESVSRVFGKGFSAAVRSVELTFSSSAKKDEKEEARIVDEDAVKALEAKITKPLFLANVRLLASAPSPFQANDLLQGLAAGFEQFAAPTRNDLSVVKVKNAAKLSYSFSFREFEPAQSIVVNSEEIASFFHLPTSATETPKVKWLKSKEAPPPADLPTAGLLLGFGSFRGEQKPVYLTDEDRRRHIYVIGQTGTGKSTFLGNLMIDDIRAGRGLAIIDPHGELVESAFRHIPKERIDDVIYFNPGDLERPVGLNMLEYDTSRPEEKTFIVNEIMGIFNKLFPPETLGPMFEQYMRNALLLLMEDMPNEATTLMEIPRLFTDAAYRARKLARIHNPVVIDFWEKEASKVSGEASLANMTTYITSKFNNFTANDYMRPIIGQPKSAFNFRQVMDEGKILLVNLSKGKIGDINANLLGMIFTGKILMAALSRVDIADAAKRRDFNLYIDEFQNFTTDSISIILSEARKYRLTLTVAHQFIAQLTEKIRDSVFGNVGSQIVFRVGVQDAEFLVKQFEPVFSQADLINIDNLNAYVKLLVKGQTSKPFNMKIATTAWEPGNVELGEKLKEYASVKFGANRQQVEEDILRRLRD